MNVGKVGRYTDIELVAETLLKCRLHLGNHGLADRLFYIIVGAVGAFAYSVGNAG
jgi:hypothetical protein